MGHRLLLHTPERYHGKPSSRPYFEGWYFKHASKDAAMSVIPGIFRGKHSRDDTAFIQVIHGSPPESHFVPYPASAFQVSNTRFELSIAQSFFSMDTIILDIDALNIKAKLTYSRHVPLDTSVFSPSIMGPFSYIPCMQCNHGVLSLWHSVNGTVRIGGRDIIYDGAHGYTEKDWGEAFPDAWLWMQCNDESASMMCAVASIPYGLFLFKGLICVLMAGGKQYRFATYNGAKVVGIESLGNRSAVRIKRCGYILDIVADNKAFGVLKAPTPDGMNRDIEESISASYRVSLYHKGKCIFARTFENGGIELSNVSALAAK